MKILIIEDEQRLARLLKKGLEENSFTVDLSFDGK
jgi:DNA-binding response OmpR family regulator